MENRPSDTLAHGYHLKGERNEYIIDRVLGQGAFGITYLARYRTTIQGAMGRGTGWTQVAVKEFFMKDMNTRDGSTGYLNDASQDSLIGRYRRAFIREARNLAGLHHDNIVNVFEVIETNNTVFIVMEYINGGSLDKYITNSGHLSEQESMEKMLKLCSAVECMHQHRMLHLDIKPKNVMLDEDGRLYLIDFGLSKQYTADGEPESSTSIGLGTPGYAPVEQAEQQDGDKRFRATIDVYALGATLFKMLTGQTPPKASQVSASALDGDNVIPNKLRESGVSASLVDIVTKAMWPSSSKRYQSVAELVTAIDTLLDGTTTDDDTVYEEPKANPTPDNNPRPQPKPEPKPESSPKPAKGLFTRLPKWLYGVVAALIVGLIVLLIIPKSKQGKETPEPDKPVEEQIITPTPTPKPEPEPEPEPEPKVVAVTSISLSKTSLTLDEGATSTLTVKYTPTDATDKSTTWKSTDTKVATVNSSGKVTAIKAGSAAIIATCGGKEAYCNITVTAKPQPLQQQSSSSTSSYTSTTSSSSSSGNSATGTSNGHEWVDLGLSVKWATCNIGASQPESYGDYYAWGETSTKSSYTWDNYRFRTSGDSYDNVIFSKYNTQSDRGTVDNKTTLDLADDVARQKWGGSWRMPTEKEFQELIDNCTWTWTTMNGVEGYKVASKKSGYTSRSIFLPAAGYRGGMGLDDAGSSGYYWSSSLNTSGPRRAYNVGFSSDDVDWYSDGRSRGQSVRAVFP